MPLIKACEEPIVAWDSFEWELSYKDEGAVQWCRLPHETVGLNAKEVAKAAEEGG